MFLLIKEVASPGVDGQPASSASSVGPRLAFYGRFGVLGLGGFPGSGGGLLPALGTVKGAGSGFFCPGSVFGTAGTVFGISGAGLGGAAVTAAAAATAFGGLPDSGGLAFFGSPLLVAMSGFGLLDWGV